MKLRTTRLPGAGAAVVVLLLASGLAGCGVDTHGNLDDKRALISQASDLRRYIGKQVTLVGTARANALGGNAGIDLRGGSVSLPAYEWPAGYPDQPVAVTGTLFERPLGVEYRAYQLGEIKGAERWSR
jgi:hypothetical protein